MKFMARYDNAVYVVEPKDTVFLPGGRHNKVKGIRANFGGRSHIFDSDSAAKTYKWDKDTQAAVEEYLIRHDDFGREIYLAPGEVVPEHLQKVYDEVRPTSGEVFFRCAKVVLIGDEFQQCEKTAIMGQDLCEDHQPSGIVRGMMTTTT